MTDVAFVALVTAVPTTLTALAGIFVSLRNGRKTDNAREQATAAAANVADVSSKADTIVSGQKEIHRLVNSNLEKVKADLEEAKAEIKALRLLLAALSGKIGGES